MTPLTPPNPPIPRTLAPPHSRRARRPIAAAVAAFSLIEILIAVIILALGLLGIGAVFPVIIREQRLASDSTYAVAVANAGKAELRSAVPGDVWAGWAEYADISGVDDPPGRWLVRRADDELLINDDTGALTLSDPDEPDPFFMPAVSRIWPSIGQELETSRPQMVWDVALHRNPYSNRIHAAVFVRRIDPRIPVPRAKTLFHVLTGIDLDNPNQRRIPVAADDNDRPTLDGATGNNRRYARPVTLDRDASPGFEIRVDERDRVYRRGTGPRWGLLAQPGQRIVDNLGNIYTVARVERDDDGEYARIVPSMRDAQINPPGENTPRIRQFVFTPHVPAEVIVFPVERR